MSYSFKTIGVIVRSMIILAEGGGENVRCSTSYPSHLKSIRGETRLEWFGGRRSALGTSDRGGGWWGPHATSQGPRESRRCRRKITTSNPWVPPGTARPNRGRLHEHANSQRSHLASIKQTSLGGTLQEDLLTEGRRCDELIF